MRLTLEKAILGNKIDAVQRILDDCPGSLEDVNDQGQTPLILAAHAQPQMVRSLLEKGADVGASDRTGATALHEAACAEHRNCAELLLGHGASISTRDHAGYTPLHIAAIADRHEIIDTLLDAEQKSSFESTINATTDRGETPLAMAVVHSAVAAVRALLRRGADVFKATGQGFTPVHLAILRERIDVVHLLIDHGADLSIATNETSVDALPGTTPLHSATLCGRIGMARLLIEKGADVWTRDAQGRTAFHHAAKRGLVDFVKLFLERGIDPLVKDDDGITALDLATKEGNEAVMDILAARLG
jgi:ankyrin repeat protein